ncbi:Gfo/Idh/MocA family oxidoreductase [Flavitalea sp. BT771]|uniref:Gfo/Idh/MocA family protein n=1 Tax=Flavitalea sp. BT771 TaxID=3063329 RepID=UPI0026E1B337|nr:Gfo/Idh/MocA family oxidoreductase [Flavitalea sp. BT771]MDO6435436.1 Gfo/Idh/MocA family oxidoreductase [Flavitalea sp. BT771]MDV6224204.1 Gfo/Idh/MocA family oxidoreductase [Flavitalea sp. BT771]
MKTKIALAGTGEWWGWHHARILSEHPDVEFCAIVGRNPERTKARAAEFGVNDYTDIQKMIEMERPDLICVCLGNKEHYLPTLQIIRAGIPLFVEKPLVFDMGEADSLIAEAESRNLFFALNFNHRWALPVEKAGQAIQDGRLGDIVYATWRFGGEGPSCYAWENLIETQCHGFDMLEHLCGPVDSIAMQASDVSGKGYSSYAIALHFAKGAVGNVTGSYDTSYAYPSTHYLEINGTKGRVVVEDTTKKYSFQEVGNETAEVWQAGYFNDKDRMFHYAFDKHFRDMLTAFRAKAAPPVHARMGRRALRIAKAAIESFESGRIVKIPTVY